MADRPASDVSPTFGLDLTPATRRIGLTVLGIALIVLGAAALGLPHLTTFAAKTLLGWLLFIGGIVRSARAFAARKPGDFVVDLAIGLLSVFVGAWLAFFPLEGIITLTLLVGALHVVQGVLQIGTASRMPARRGRTGTLVVGILSALIGVLIFAHFPGSTAWAIAHLVGINLIVSGVSYISLAWRDESRTPEPASADRRG